MGAHENITFDRFPKQGSFYGKRVVVCFHYDTSKTMDGIVVRDDAEEPHEMIIQLVEWPGRYIRGVECQYRIAG